MTIALTPELKYVLELRHSKVRQPEFKRHRTAVKSDE